MSVAIIFLKHCSHFFNDNFESISVLLSAVASISLWWLEVEFMMKLLVSVVTFVYICIKIYKLIK